MEELINDLIRSIEEKKIKDFKKVLENNWLKCIRAMLQRDNDKLDYCSKWINIFQSLYINGGITNWPEIDQEIEGLEYLKIILLNKGKPIKD